VLALHAPIRKYEQGPSTGIRTYRPFIDGLRAVAILTVVGSHLDLPGFTGGYIGVDIFFVISGYLIIGQIVEDIKKERFHLFDFFARRAFRILPAFLFVMVSCGLLATIVFVQPQTKEFASAFLYTAIMLSNHYLLAHQGYFDMAAFTKPLLHMWSLAVEEQFYIVAPLLLIGLSAATSTVRAGTRNMAWTGFALAIGALSFAGCVLFTYPTGSPNYGFYLMPLRGWEFILGGLVPAVGARFSKAPSWLIHSMALSGVGAVLVAVVFLDENTLYPSYWAALPALGAWCLIVAGLSDARNLVARALAMRPMVAIGLVSYSWYLWHWPLISFMRTLNFGQSTRVEELSVGVASLALAGLTYHYIEWPVRALRQRLAIEPFWLAAGGAVSCATIAVVGYAWSYQVAPHMLPQITGLQPIHYSEPTHPPISHNGLLLGDSHANPLKEPLQQFALREGANLRKIGHGGCLPLLLIRQRDNHDKCDPVYNQIEFKNAEFVIFAVRWNYYLGLPPSDSIDRSDLLLARPSSNRLDNPYDVLERALDATVVEAMRNGVSRILLIAPVPEFPWYAPYCVMQSIRAHMDFCTIARKRVEDRRRRTMVVLQQVADRYKAIRIIDPIDLFCTRTECRPNDGRTLFFFDANHLSPAGIDYLKQAFRQQFIWVLTGSASDD
jgi:peptidoglycan/LPS O-acetylase OafA/YrhL